MIVSNESPPEEVLMVPAPTPSYSAPKPQNKFDTTFEAPNLQPPPEQPPTAYNAPEQPPTAYNAPEQPPTGYNAPEQPPPDYSAPEQPPPVVEEQPPPSTYTPSFAPEQPPSTYERPTTSTTTTRRTTTRRTTIFIEQPPTTYAPAFEEELPPYRQEENLPSYGNQNDLPGYNQQGSEAIFVTPTPPPIIIPPKTMPGRRKKPSKSFVNPRSGQQKFAFSTLLPPFNSIQTTTPRPSKAQTPTPTSFSEIFSNLKKNEKQSTSFRNNAPPSTNYNSNDVSYGKPLGKPITTSNDDYEYPFYETLTPPKDQTFTDYDYNDGTISGIDPRFNDNFSDVVSDNPSFDIIEKLQKTKDNSIIQNFQFANKNNVKNKNINIRVRGHEDTTKIKGRLKEETSTLSRFTDARTQSPPPSEQFSGGYSGPIPETKPPEVFTDILDTTETSYETRPPSNNYQSPPKRPDTSYSISVDPEDVTNGHSGKIKIDINVNINGDDDNYGRGMSNSHGPVQTTYQTPTESNNLPNSGYATPTESSNVGPTTTNSYSAPVDEGYSAPVTDDYSFSDLLENTNSHVKPTDSYESPTVKPYKNKEKKPSYPRTYGSKVVDDRPNDFVAPDYNEEFYKDDFTAPDIVGEYETPSAPVVDDYYKPDEYFPDDEYTAPVVDDYYYGHEAPGYDNFEEDFYIEKPHYHHKKKHKKVKPFVDFGEHSKPYKKHKHKEVFYEPLEKPFYDPDPYEPPYEPAYEPPQPYEEPFYEPLEKPHYEEPYHEPETYYEPPTQYEEPEYYNHDDGVYLDPVPRGYYDKTTELIPELKDIIKPLDWNVHDFSSWRRLLDPSRFGGTLKHQRHESYGKYLPYEPKTVNDVSYDVPHYGENIYDDPLYYEDYTEKPTNYVEYDDTYEYSPPHNSHMFDYETYDPFSYIKPQPKQLEIPKPFEEPFEAWLDSSGVGAFGLPSSTYRSYASPPLQYSHSSNIGQRHHEKLSKPYYTQDAWIPSERPLKYKPSYLQYHEKTQVELPFLTEPNPSQYGHTAKVRHIEPKLYTPPPKTYQQSGHNVEYRKVKERYKKSTTPGSIWTGLSSFVSSLDTSNHYRNHPIGMVSMGSNNYDLMTFGDMAVMGSQENAVMIKPPSDFNVTGFINKTSFGASDRNIKAAIETPSGVPSVPSVGPELFNIDHDSQFSVSVSELRENITADSSNNTTENNTVSSQENNKIFAKDFKKFPHFENYLIDSTYFGSTIQNMAKMLETYLR